MPDSFSSPALPPTEGPAFAMASVAAVVLSIAAGAGLWWLAGAQPQAGGAGMPWLRSALFFLTLAAPLALALCVLLQWRRERARAAVLHGERARRRQALLQLLDPLPSAVALCATRDDLLAPNLAMAHLLRLDRGAAGNARFDWLQALSPEDRPAWQAAIDTALRSGRPQWLECTMQLQGSDCQLLAQIAPHAGDDGFDLAVCLTSPEGETGLAQQTVLQMRELLALAEAEKWHFGQAVHDELGQRLSGMAYFAKALQRKLQKAERPESEDAGWLTDLANESMSVARGLARGLLPVGSDDPGALGAALAELCEKTGKSFAVECHLSVDPGFDAGGAAQASQLYHAVQELVNNAVKHGLPRQVRVRLQVLDDRQRATVEDDGSGLPAGPLRRGMGLSGVRSRAAYLGAQFSIANQQQGGAQACIEWPRAGDPST